MTPENVDAQRKRWAAFRATQSLHLGLGTEFATGGLAAQVASLTVRVLVLPADPLIEVVNLDREAQAWLQGRRSPPFGGPPFDWGGRERATSGALVAYAQGNPDDSWHEYLALHRHGGLDAATDRYAWPQRDGVRVFGLREIVGFVWHVAALQVEAVERWPISGPFELTVALANTRGANLGGFAEGWRQPGAGFWDGPACIEQHCLFRFETKEIEPETLAMDLADRIENAFGSTHRRHIAQRGEFEGRFDPRFQL